MATSLLRTVAGSRAWASALVRARPGLLARPLPLDKSVHVTAVAPVIARQALKRFDDVTPPGSSAYGRHWTIERYLAVSLLGTIPAALVFPCAALNYLVCVSALVHGHWGMIGVCKDYLHYRGPLLLNLAKGLVYSLTILGLAGLLHFNYSDVGAVHAVRLLWRV